MFALIRFSLFVSIMFICGLELYLLACEKNILVSKSPHLSTKIEPVPDVFAGHQFVVVRNVERRPVKAQVFCTHTPYLTFLSEPHVEHVALGPRDAARIRVPVTRANGFRFCDAIDLNPPVEQQAARCDVYDMVAKVYAFLKHRLDLLMRQ